METTYNPHKTVLHEVVPLELPFNFIFHLISVCNFKCNYCIQKDVLNSTLLQRFLNSHKGLMKFDDFKKIIDNLSEYIINKCPDKKLKLLSLSGFGETLMHPDIIQMLRYAKKANIADRIQLLTNGTMLTEKMSDALINSGLDLIKVALQGVDKETYKNTCDYNIDFDKYVSHLEYFFNNRKNCFLYVKIADSALRNKEDEQKFFGIFSSISDNANIEHIVDGNGLNYDRSAKERRSIIRNAVIDDTVCNVAFRILETDIVGDVFPCPRYDENGYKGPCIGNMLTAKFEEIWNVGVHADFLRSTLEHRMEGECKDCHFASYWSTDLDLLKGHEHEILKRMNENRRLLK
jgi:radical SAM protein with 4Fe4S-binding SPASM domain